MQICSPPLLEFNLKCPWLGGVGGSPVLIFMKFKVWTNIWIVFYQDISRLCELTKQMVTATLQPSARDRRTFTFVWSAPRRERGSTSVTLCPGSAWDITLFREYFDIFILISISHDKDFCPRFTHQRIWMSVKKKLGLYIQYNVSASSDECWTSDHSNTFFTSYRHNQFISLLCSCLYSKKWCLFMPAGIVSYLPSDDLIEILSWRYLFWLTICILSPPSIPWRVDSDLPSSSLLIISKWKIQIV